MNIFNASIALLALVVSIISLIVTWMHTRKSFRPIVTVMVKTHSGGNMAICYDLVIQNSGSLPARDVRIEVNSETLNNALTKNEEYKDISQSWLSCFSLETLIFVLLNGEKITCSFGLTKDDGRGFWRYGSIIDVVVKY